MIKNLRESVPWRAVGLAAWSGASLAVLTVTVATHWLT